MAVTRAGISSRIVRKSIGKFLISSCATDLGSEAPIFMIWDAITPEIGPNKSAGCYPVSFTASARPTPTSCMKKASR